MMESLIASLKDQKAVYPVDTTGQPVLPKLP